MKAITPLTPIILITLSIITLIHSLTTKQQNGPIILPETNALTSQDGPLTQNDALDILNGEYNPNIAIVHYNKAHINSTFAHHLVESSNINLIFKDEAQDVNATVINNAMISQSKETARINNQKFLIKKAEKTNSNAFKDIFDKELMDDDDSMKNRHYRKNLLELAVEKENEIYSNMKLREIREHEQIKINSMISKAMKVEQERRFNETFSDRYDE